MYYKGHEPFTKKIQGQIKLCQIRNQSVQTSFLSGVEILILKRMIPNSMYLTLEGGYKDALRKVALISSYEIEEVPEISTLVSDYDPRFQDLEHRHVLGALMNLGIDRDQVGDILVEEKRIVVFCTTTMKDYIIQSCTRIGHCPIEFKETKEVLHLQNHDQEIKVNCASLRMDVLVSSLAHCSRKEALHKIHQGSVKLNEVILEENDQLCNNDFVSIRRIGKFQFLGIESTTKKNRYILRFKQFL